MQTKKAVLFLIIIGLAVYFNSLFNGFVWDDEEQILNNTLVHSITNFPSFFSGSTFNTGGSGGLGGLYYKPLMTASFALIYTIFGPNPFFFHFFQVLFHIGNSILLFLLLKHFLKPNTTIPFILAAIFLIHPINSEAVVYISDLQDILYFFFGMLALTWVIRTKLASWKNTAVVSLLLLASLLSKETSVAFLATIFIYLGFFQRKSLIRYTVTAFSALGIYSILRFAVAGIFFNKHGLSPITVMPFQERILSIPKIVFSYVKNFIYPKDLAINQHWVVKSLDFDNFYLPLILSGIFMALFFGGAFYIWYRRREAPLPYLFFLTLFLIGLGLHLQVFPLDLTISDRWFYMPMAGILGMVGIALHELRVKGAEFRIAGLLLIALLITGLSVRTIVRNTNWRDGLTLYGTDVQISKDSFDLENNFGVELYRAGRFEEAEARFVKSTKLAPHWWTNWNNLGALYERYGEYQKAKEYYQKAIDNGGYYLAYENLASILLFRNNDPLKAKQFSENSLQKLPLNSKLWLILAISEYQLGNTQKALEASRRAYAISPTQQTYYVYSSLSQNLPLEFK